MQDEPSSRGRPSVYTEGIALEICDRLAEGESLNSICKTAYFPAESTVRSWALSNLNGFSAKYAHARELQAHKFACDVIDIADQATDAALARLQVDARKWVCSKVLPKVYGDKTAVEHSGSIGLSGILEEINGRSADLPSSKE